MSPSALAADLWRYRDLLTQFTQRDIASRHKGTQLGLVWTVLNPLLTLGIYTLIFTQVFPSNWDAVGAAGPTGSFVLNFFCGFVVYGIFSETASRAPGLVLDRPNLVRKVVFPLEVLPAAGLLASLVFGAIGIGILLIATGAVARLICATALLLPLVLLPLCMLSLGVSWFLAALGVFIRDTKQVLPVLMQLLFFATPVLYPIRKVPEQYQWVLRLNPFTTIVEASRAILLKGVLPDWPALGLVAAIGLVVMQLGYACFMRSKRGFADVM